MLNETSDLTICSEWYVEILFKIDGIENKSISSSYLTACEGGVEEILGKYSLEHSTPRNNYFARFLNGRDEKETIY